MLTVQLAALATDQQSSAAQVLLRGVATGVLWHHLCGCTTNSAFFTYLSGTGIAPSQASIGHVRCGAVEHAG